MIFNVNCTFFNKMRQIQFANQVKKQKKQNIRKKKKRFCITSTEPLKVRLQKFLGCRGYLPKAKSL